MSMKRLLPAFAATALLGACASEPADAASGAPAAPGDGSCDVTVVFGSYAMGIDTATLERVTTYLEDRRDVVAQSETTAWGREGERTICIDARNDEAARRIYSALEGMAPATAQRGPITITSKFGDRFHSKSPAGMRR